MNRANSTRFALLVVTLAAAACERPMLSHDGQVVFQQNGAHGATMLTANGVEFLDRTTIPQAIVRKSVDEPWKPATGFLLPADGVFRKTSSPTPVEGHGLLVLVRTSDTLVPSWGGEVLVRFDAIAPAKAFPAAAAIARAPVEVVVVVDGSDANVEPLVDVAIENASERDRVGVVDSAHGHAVLPPLPGSHQTLLHAAVERLVDQNAHAKTGTPRDLAGALRVARGFFGVAESGRDPDLKRRVLVITDGIGVVQGGARVTAEARALAKAGVEISAVGSTDEIDAKTLEPLADDITTGGAFNTREDAVGRSMPPPGAAVLADVQIELSSVPAPTHVLEVSGGHHASLLHRDLLTLGEMVAGEARTEIARVVIPPWVPGEPLELTVTAKYKDIASGKPQTAYAVVKCRYTNDVEAIASSRHGDVIAYASALAMVRRLQRSFLGSSADRLGGLRPLVANQARSLGQLATLRRDEALAMQADVLRTLLAVVDD